MIQLHKKRHMCGTNGSLAIAMRPKAECIFQAILSSRKVYIFLRMWLSHRMYDCYVGIADGRKLKMLTSSGIVFIPCSVKIAYISDTVIDNITRPAFL